MPMTPERRMLVWNRRRFLAAGGAVSAGLILGACGLGEASSPEPGASDDANGWSGALIEPPFPKPAVTFTDVDGNDFDFVKETDGKLALLFFGYTNCPDVCPVTLNTLAAAKRSLSGPGSEPMVLFVGVDTERDTPESMKNYLGNIDPDFIGLTATDEVISEAISAVMGAPVELGEPDDDGNYPVGHPSQVTAYTADNVAHRIFVGAPPNGMRAQDWAADLPRLAKGVYQ